MSSPQYLVALPFAPWEIGPYEGKSSLHCTVVHWFSLPPSISEADVRAELYAIGTEMRLANIELVSAEESNQFGPNADVRVSVLEKNQAVDRLHLRLLKFLRANKCILSREDWVGDGFRAHVTPTNGQTFEIGQRQRVSSVALLKRTADGAKSVIYQLHY